MRAVSWWVAFGAGALALRCVWPSAVGAVDVGQAAPPLVVKRLDGQLYDLGALRGKVVVVNFWATWCPPCRAEMPELDAFYRKYHGRGAELLGVSTDRARDRPEVLKLAQSVSYPAAMLSDATTDGFRGPEGLPFTVVIDRRGMVRAKMKRPVTEKDLDDAVEPLLSE